MRLTDDEMSKLSLFLGQKWKKPGCPRCEADAWTVTGRGFLHLPFRPVTRAGVSMDAAALVCKNCGHIELIDLAIAGIA